VISLRLGFCSALTFVGLHSQDCQRRAALKNAAGWICDGDWRN
jgi:hypothetical protein